MGVCTLLHLCEGALVDTFDKFGLYWHIRVLVKNFIIGKKITFSTLLSHLWLNDLSRGKVHRVIDRMRMYVVLIVVNGLVHCALLFLMQPTNRVRPIEVGPRTPTSNVRVVQIA